ncbi:hypothetical protein RI444_15320 [Paenarthrobacter sp. AT5]|uniref:hypothetical protein n=1 Tax=Paenarthrobacter TaxID=1742992 RepID=UPI001A998810|nr:MULTISPECIES: hypothetical protein [Paenarthrobacter]QSZ53297.1 hypothetical protein AYX19_09950 [Paenarthrobacter ureafaciens]WOC59877.1 hypothetical protein RI444_15320 [Paenarthrobacter sp. AT5]
MKELRHFLKRNPDNEAVCACGFRPDILDDPAPVGVRWKAKRDVLDHVEKVLGLRPAAPFESNQEQRFPRAGVRPGANGRWRLTLWDEEGVMHPQPDPWFDTAQEAFDQGHLIIGTHWKAGSRLNGMAR